MGEELYVDGLGFAPGVMETIVAIAANEVDGVAVVGSSSFSGLRSHFGAKPGSQGIDVSKNETDGIDVSVHIEVYYGKPIPQIADAVRAAVVDAVSTQIGIEIASVDVFVDGIRFAD